MWTILLLLSLTHPTWASTITPYHQGGEQRNTSACINQTEKTLTVDCEAGHMIRINGLFYGSGDQCGYTPGDCIMKDTDANLPCVGHRTCSINLPSGELGRKLPGCDLHSTYIQLNYQCVPVEDSYDICRTASLQRQWGYIHTPGYPHNYVYTGNCTLHLVLQHDQKIRLHVVDFDLASGETCVDDLYLKSPLNSQTRCGTRTPQLVFTSYHNTMSLTFNSHGGGQNKGFWLYYEADPLRAEPTTTTTMSTTSSSSVASTSPARPERHKPGLIAREVSTTENHSDYNVHPTATPTPTNVPIAAIVGGILGALLFILLIIVLLLIFRRIQKRRQKENEIIFSNSNKYLNSKTGPHLHGTPGPYIQNNLNLNLHNRELDDHDKLFYKDELVHKV